MDSYLIVDLPIYKTFDSPLTKKQFNDFVKLVATKLFGHENFRQECVKGLNDCYKKLFENGKDSVSKVLVEIYSKHDNLILIQLKTTDFDKSWVGYTHLIGSISGIEVRNTMERIKGTLKLIVSFREIAEQVMKFCFSKDEKNLEMITDGNAS